MAAPSAELATWAIAGTATLGVILRPFAWPEAVWAMLGAGALVGLGLIAPGAAWAGILKGTDVYLFLIGMMLLSEVARREGLFDWLAVLAVRAARGSATRLFTLVYGVGVGVTAFLSNDACAVVLTPAVYAAARAAAVAPMPYLLICAFVANAASFVLPISNPANLVVYAARMPPLTDWLARFALPSGLAILSTYAALRLTQGAVLRRQPAIAAIETRPLPRAGLVAGLGLVLTAAALLAASARGLELGPPTFLAGGATTLVVLAMKRGGFLGIVREISWGVLPLVAGLFVLVEALAATGVLRALTELLQASVRTAPSAAPWGAEIVVAVLCNLVNNLPAGLIAGAALQAADVSERVGAAVLVGIDLGPNLSVTGSLATILWLTAIRREGESISAWRFLALGLVVTPPALLLALAGILLVP